MSKFSLSRTCRGVQNFLSGKFETARFAVERRQKSCGGIEKNVPESRRRIQRGRAFQGAVSLRRKRCHFGAENRDRIHSAVQWILSACPQQAGLSADRSVAIAPSRMTVERDCRLHNEHSPPHVILEARKSQPACPQQAGLAADR